jgi:hypothetical protein
MCHSGPQPQAGLSLARLTERMAPTDVGEDADAWSKVARVTSISRRLKSRWVFFQPRSKSSQTIQMTDRKRNRLDAAKTTLRKSML